MMTALGIKSNIADFSMTAKSLQPALIVNTTIEFKTVQSFAERDIVRKLENAKPDFQFEGIEPDAISMSSTYTPRSSLNAVRVPVALCSM